MKPEELRMFVERELDAVSLIAETARLPVISDAVLRTRGKLGEQLRLAVVGKTKAGKSTLLNALLKISELPMGDTIVTGNVSVLLHVDKSPSKKEMAIVHLSDGTEKPITLVQYQELVDIRKPDILGIRDQITWFDVYLKHPVLRDMSIIDTPGDDSWLKTDSENTKELFRDKNRKPDIIIYVVQKEFGDKDINAAQEYLSQINGAKHRVSGLNVVAVYSCCDTLIAGDIDGCDWGIDFRKEGNRIINNNREKSSAFRMCFSKCFPVAGMFALASQTITVEDFSILQGISKSRFSEYFYRDFSAIEYSTMETEYPELFGIFKEESIKNSMLSKLGLDTMKYIVWWCNKNPNKPIGDLRIDLENYSNVPALRSYIFDEHFKKFSLFYKAICFLPELRKVVEKEYNSCFDSDKSASLRKILEMCQNAERKIYSQYGFLSVMRDYYDCNDYFDEEDWALALKTIEYCVSDVQNASTKNSIKEQWQERLDFYKFIGNHFAVDSSGKLIESLEKTNK